jgi:hypothetical protein
MCPQKADIHARICQSRKMGNCNNSCVRIGTLTHPLRVAIAFSNISFHPLTSPTAQQQLLPATDCTTELDLEFFILIASDTGLIHRRTYRHNSLF